jgi:Zn-dependent peptidase ImmA (M78 family)
MTPDLPPAEEFAVLAHELAHELLHRGERRKETSKTIRETEAEAVAFVVCQAVGLETTTRSSDYIQLYSGTKDTLAESLEHIQKTAAAILAGLHETAC